MQLTTPAQRATRISNQRMGETVGQWMTRLGSNGKRLSLEEFTDCLNDLPYVAKTTRQAVHLWLTGKRMPWVDRAARNLMVAPAQAWQREFWREVLEIIAPDDEILTHPLAQDTTTPTPA